jgi:hypothetical protein
MLYEVNRQAITIGTGSKVHATTQAHVRLQEAFNALFLLSVPVMHCWVGAPLSAGVLPARAWSAARSWNQQAKVKRRLRAAA